MSILLDIVQAQKKGKPAGIYSCCSANEFVLRAALKRGKKTGTPVLIESTANQVDQFGGYTGMKPADFFAYVNQLAGEIGIAPEQVLLGGDHLGPLTWSHLPEEEAMRRAVDLVQAYVAAGFEKIHLDTSMRLADDSQTERLPDAVIARRGAVLCAAAEEAFGLRKETQPDAKPPVYIIGSEVPIPGGAQEAEESVSVTKPADCRRTVSVFQEAFARRGLQAAWERVIGLVVQPGVEFGDAEVFDYDREKAKELTAVLSLYPNLVFEGHSTDYQTAENLKKMVEDGIAILKVGPALTFGLREALLALECIERELLPLEAQASRFREVLEQVMLAKPANWQKHYHGTAAQLKLARTFSFSDRARYYLPEPELQEAIRRLLANLRQTGIPYTLLSQYLPIQYARVRAGALSSDPAALIEDRVGDYIDDYLYSIAP